MNDPKNPTISPEFGPRSVGPMGSTIRVGGEITNFNQPPSTTRVPKDPEAIINEAYARGDTIKERSRQFQEAMTPPPEQK